jgi:hypothetical protein
LIDPDNIINRIPRDLQGPYTNDIGKYLCKSLFWETRRLDKLSSPPIYTLKDKDLVVDGVTYFSLRRLYLETADLTEYEFATKYLDSWEHWELLSNRAWFQPYIKAWRTELEIKLKSEALKRLYKEAVEGGKNQYNANKFFVEKGWIDKTTEETRRGRPSKQEIARKAAEEVFSSNQISEAAKRLEIN